jgi:hypothetical protein
MIPAPLATALHESSPEAGIWPLRSFDFNGVLAFGNAVAREDHFAYLRTAAGDGGSWLPRGGLAKT